MGLRPLHRHLRADQDGGLRLHHHQRVSAYHGYYTQGGTREVGRSSTRAVVYSSIVILLANYLLTQLLLL